VNELWDRLQAGAEQIGTVVPALLGAGVILLTGYFLARQIQRWADDTLKRLDFNRMAAAGGLDEVVVRTGSRLDPVRALGKLIFWLVMLVVILLASTALGLESVNQMFGTMLAFIPTLIAAIVIVILGMILGNTLTGVSLAIERMTEALTARRDRVEMALALGATRWEAARGPARQAARAGMIPTLNQMAVVGVVSLPGMMTGQVLAGQPPLQAVRYQIVIMFLIAAASAMGTVAAVLLTYRRLFSADHRFNAEQLVERTRSR